jgi:hypothetical protein
MTRVVFRRLLLVVAVATFFAAAPPCPAAIWPADAPPLVPTGERQGMESAESKLAYDALQTGDAAARRTLAGRGMAGVRVLEDYILWDNPGRQDPDVYLTFFNELEEADDPRRREHRSKELQDSIAAGAAAGNSMGLRMLEGYVKHKAARGGKSATRQLLGNLSAAGRKGGGRADDFLAERYAAHFDELFEPRWDALKANPYDVGALLFFLRTPFNKVWPRVSQLGEDDRLRYLLALMYTRPGAPDAAKLLPQFPPAVIARAVAETYWPVDIGTPEPVVPIESAARTGKAAKVGAKAAKSANLETVLRAARPQSWFSDSVQDRPPTVVYSVIRLQFPKSVADNAGAGDSVRNAKKPATWASVEVWKHVSFLRGRDLWVGTKDGVRMAERAAYTPSGRVTMEWTPAFPDPRDRYDIQVYKAQALAAGAGADEFPGGAADANPGAGSPGAGGGASGRPAAPARKPVPKARPKRVVFVADASGSMIDVMDLQKQRLRDGVASLEPGQLFNVIFASGAFEPRNYSAFSPKPVPATNANKRAAHKFIDGIMAKSTGAMTPAALAALESRPDALWLMSDGDLDSEPNLVAELTRRNMTAKARIGTVQVGSDGGEIWERYTRVLIDLARQNRGVCIDLNGHYLVANPAGGVAASPVAAASTPNPPPAGEATATTPERPPSGAERPAAGRDPAAAKPGDNPPLPERAPGESIFDFGDEF